MVPATNCKATQRGPASVSVLPFSTLSLPVIILFGFDSFFCCDKNKMTFEQGFERIEGASYVWYWALFLLLNDTLLEVFPY